MAERYITILTTWKFTSMDPLNILLGPTALLGRRYPDSTGKIDFAHLQGGLLLPEISATYPATIAYNHYTMDMTLSFYYWKKKALKENGEIVYKTV
jgi:hypothetical protein